MHKTFLALLLIAASLCPKLAKAQNVIPQPREINMGKGFFTITPSTPVEMNFEGNEARLFKDYIGQTLGLKVFKGAKISKTPAMRLNWMRVKQLPGNPRTSAEAYQLDVTPKRITITAHTTNGLFYGLQTLRQLTTEGNKVACAVVNDEPRFPYRGMMLDCSRHFFTPQFIKKQLDATAYFKLNRFHWHLTDGGGWRLEVKKYPKLIEETAYRTQNDWTKWWRENDRRHCLATDSGAYGGYYTQEQVRDIVQYAAKRHITIIPEIEMPGHSNEVFVAYPNLTCSGKAYTGSDFCPGNDSVFTFLENVLTEVMQLFPSQYIHIGGDEASQVLWKTCPKCQKRMQDEGLKDTHELQAYFVMRIEKFLNAHGRKLLGWDEIMQGRLAPNAAVMSWTGEEAGLKAAKAGHHVVMTPGAYCYLDMYQDVPFSQPKAMGGFVPLEKVYAYEPIANKEAADTLERYVDGVQGNLWTEEVPTPEHAEYMLYPRLFAIAEVGWTRNKPSYDNFRNRALLAVDRLRSWGYHPFDLKSEHGPRQESLSPVQHLALGKPVVYRSRYEEKYRGAGDGTLTDGLRGNWVFKGERWQGFIGGEYMDAVVDLGAETDIKEVSADFMQSLGVDIVFPDSVELLLSSDGQNFTSLQRHDMPQRDKREYFIQPFTWKGSAKARYVRLHAKQGAAGGWVFCDEIKVW